MDTVTPCLGFPPPGTLSWLIQLWPEPRAVDALRGANTVFELRQQVWAVRVRGALPRGGHNSFPRPWRWGCQGLSPP